MSRTARLLSGAMALPLVAAIVRRTVLAGKSASPRSWRIAPATNGAGTAYDRSVFVVMVGGCRPGHRQRHRRPRLLAGLAHVPLAHAVAAGSFGEVHMHVVLVIAVGARTKDRGEARAGALAQAETKILADLRIGQPHDGAVGKLYRSDVDSVCLAVFGELCADDPIAAAAVIGGVVVEAPERRAEVTHRGGQVLPYPLHDGLGKRAANDSGRRQRHPRFVPQEHRFEPHAVFNTALTA